MTIVFDTLKLSDQLAAGGFTAQQAKTAAIAFSDAFRGDLATKTDVSGLRSEVKAEIAQFRSEVKAEIAQFRSEVKAEIAELRSEVKAEIAELRLELKTELAKVRTEIAETKADLIKWLVGAIGFQTVVIVGALVTLLRVPVR